MRLSSAVLLLLVLFLSPLVKSVIYIHWKWNQAQIIQQDCENRNRPSRHCNGKCQLRKKLSQVEKNNTTSSFPIEELVRVETALFFHENEFPSSGTNSYSLQTGLWMNYDSSFLSNRFFAIPTQPPDLRFVSCLALLT
jgi:hypothetical protein